MDVTDTFNRADNTTSLGTTSDGLASWVTYGPSVWGIISNQATCKSGTGGGVSFATVETSVANGTLTAVTNVSFQGGLVFRVSDALNYWLFTAGGAFFKVIAGSFNSIASVSSTSAGSTLKAVFSGSSISIYQDTTLLASTTDSFNASATQHGIESNQVDGSSRLDSFSFVGSAGPAAYRVPAIRTRRNQAVIRAAVR